MALTGLRGPGLVAEKKGVSSSSDENLEAESAMALPFLLTRENAK
jgi:hypothetical protein